MIIGEHSNSLNMFILYLNKVISLNFLSVTRRRKGNAGMMFLPSDLPLSFLIDKSVTSTPVLMVMAWHGLTEISQAWYAKTQTSPTKEPYHKKLYDNQIRRLAVEIHFVRLNNWPQKNPRTRASLQKGRNFFAYFERIEAKKWRKRDERKVRVAHQGNSGKITRMYAYHFPASDTP